MTFWDSSYVRKINLIWTATPSRRIAFSQLIPVWWKHCATLDWLQTQARTERKTDRYHFTNTLGWRPKLAHRTLKPENGSDAHDYICRMLSISFKYPAGFVRLVSWVGWLVGLRCWFFERKCNGRDIRRSRRKVALSSFAMLVILFRWVDRAESRKFAIDATRLSEQLSQ